MEQSFNTLIKEISEEIEKIDLAKTEAATDKNVQKEMLLLFLGSFIEEEVNERSKTGTEQSR